MKKDKKVTTPDETSLITKDAFELMNRALLVKNDSINNLRETLEKENDLKLLSNPDYVKFHTTREKILLLKGLLTAVPGQSEFHGVMGEKNVDPVYDSDDSLHIKAKIQELIKLL